MKTNSQAITVPTSFKEGLAPHQVSFEITDIPLAEQLLAEVDYKTAIETYLGGPVEAGSWQSKKLVQAAYHPFAAMLHQAYADHRPIMISPDHIWLLICQGFASHINNHAKALRKQFVRHEGKKEILVRRDDFIKGKPTNPWEEVFPEFCAQIRAEIGDTQDMLIANFSTSGSIEKAACEISLMDAMQRYFSYVFMTTCGIPSITIEGTPEDWQSIVARVEQFNRFELGGWVKALRSILEQFVQASQGHVDKNFWNSIYKKVYPGSGQPYIHGWFIKFFPYVVGPDGRTTCQNRYLEKEPMEAFRGLTTDAFPSGLSKAPFTWLYFSEKYEMEFLAGFIGIFQDKLSKALRPEIGWAVREVTKAVK